MGGETAPHLATTLGARTDPDFQVAYWRAFDRTFGEANAKMVKTMLLSKVKSGDTGELEIDRVCLGLRMTMGWLADAIERNALHEAGYEISLTAKGGDPPQAGKKKVAP